MASKRQFLDPINTCSKLIMLLLVEPNTKIRIYNHTIIFSQYNYFESFINRPINGDSRNDMCALFPAINRFIELYLLAKKEANNSSASNTPKKQKLTSFLGGDDESDNESQSDIIKVDESSNDKCYLSLVKLAKYMKEGISRLAKLYGDNNATFTLQYFSVLIQAGIDGTYSEDMIPDHLRQMTNQNLLDVSKIKELWKNDDIINLADLFEKCFDSIKKDDRIMTADYKDLIDKFLKRRDNKFIEIISTTNQS